MCGFNISMIGAFYHHIKITLICVRTGVYQGVSFELQMRISYKCFSRSILNSVHL